MMTIDDVKGIFYSFSSSCQKLPALKWEPPINVYQMNSELHITAKNNVCSCIATLLAKNVKMALLQNSQVRNPLNSMCTLIIAQRAWHVRS